MDRYEKVVPYIVAYDPDTTVEPYKTLYEWYEIGRVGITAAGMVVELANQLSWLLSDEAAHMIAERLVNMYYYGVVNELDGLKLVYMSSLDGFDLLEPCWKSHYDWKAHDFVNRLREKEPDLYQLIKDNVVVMEYTEGEPSQSLENQSLVDKVAQYVSQHLTSSGVADACQQLKIVIDDVKSVIDNPDIPTDDACLPLIDVARWRDAIISANKTVYSLLEFQFYVSLFYMRFYTNREYTNLEYTNTADYDSHSKLWGLGIAFQQAMEGLDGLWNVEDDPCCAEAFSLATETDDTGRVIMSGCTGVYLEELQNFEFTMTKKLYKSDCVLDGF